MQTSQSKHIIKRQSQARRKELSDEARKVFICQTKWHLVENIKVFDFYAKNNENPLKGLAKISLRNLLCSIQHALWLLSL